MNIPSKQQMTRAFFASDSQYDGIFYTGVKTTGIFCRPTCPARKPKPENVEFFPAAKDALFAGYRACKRCRPLDQPGATPDWIKQLIDDVAADPQYRWRDQDLRGREIEPARARRWFKKHYGMTFHAYARALRLGQALDHLDRGQSVTTTGFDHGFDSLSGFTEAMKKITGKAPSGSAQLRKILWRRISTPLGPMIGAATDEALVLLEFADRRALEKQCQTVCRRFQAVLVPGDNSILQQAEEQVGQYFEGKRREFELPLDYRGTDFQQRTWQALMTVPFGETESYAGLAERLGKPTAVRAVGRTNGDNRIAIVIPCHRVVGADGKLTGYAGGLWRKQKLLDLEQQLAGFSLR